MRFRDDGGIRAVLVNFACHPVTGWGIKNVSEDMVSSDYPHYLRETIKASYGCPVLFSLGAAGDVVPIDRLGDCRQMIGGRSRQCCNPRRTPVQSGHSCEARNCHSDC